MLISNILDWSHKKPKVILSHYKLTMFKWLKNLGKKQSSKRSINKNKPNPSKEGKKASQDVLTLKDIVAQFYFLPGLVASKHDCQDTYGLYNKHMKDFSFYLVLDGHGSLGKEASNSVCDFMLAHIDKISAEIIAAKDDQKTEKILRTMFRKAESALRSCGMDMDVSGTTCVCLLVKGTTVFVANVGDSRAVLGRVLEDARYAIELTQDHTPNLKEERERIVRSGGYIKQVEYQDQVSGPYRIWADEHGPGLASTRSIGDFLGKNIGMTSQPQIQKFNLKEFDQFVVIATDGIWEVMSSAEVVAYILTLGADREQAAKQLVSEARDIWQSLNRCKKTVSRISDLPGARSSIDDISCIVLFFNFEGITQQISTTRKVEPSLTVPFLMNSGGDKKKEEEIKDDISDMKDSRHGYDYSLQKPLLTKSEIKSNPFKENSMENESARVPLTEAVSKDETKGKEIEIEKKILSKENAILDSVNNHQSTQNKNNQNSKVPKKEARKSIESPVKDFKVKQRTERSQSIESSSRNEKNSSDFVGDEENDMYTIIEYQSRINRFDTIRAGMTGKQSHQRSSANIEDKKK